MRKTEPFKIKCVTKLTKSFVQYNKADSFVVNRCLGFVDEVEYYGI